MSALEVGAAVKESSPHFESGRGGLAVVGGRENSGIDQAGTGLWPCRGERLPPEGALFGADLGQLDQPVGSSQALDGESALQDGPELDGVSVLEDWPAL